MLDAIDKVEEYLSGVDRRQFSEKTLVQDAVIRQIQIIGEAAKRLPPPWRNQHDDIPWSDIAGMRDKLVHDYFGVDISQVWSVATDDLPALKEALAAVASVDTAPSGE